MTVLDIGWRGNLVESLIIMPRSKSNLTKPALNLCLRDFQKLSLALSVIAEHAPDRMTLPQVLFFIEAARADLAGKQPTFSTIKNCLCGSFNKSLHTTYRILLEPSRAFPQGLGWLVAEQNPEDLREKHLRLTESGRSMLLSVADTFNTD